VTDARAFLTGLFGKRLTTVGRAQPNRILRIEGDVVIVATSRSPKGQPVPIAWVQDAIDILERDGEVGINVSTVGHRSAFVGAVLRELPSAQVGDQSIRLR
jgi:hypothetical protein